MPTDKVAKHACTYGETNPVEGGVLYDAIEGTKNYGTALQEVHLGPNHGIEKVDPYESLSASKVHSDVATIVSGKLLDKVSLMVRKCGPDVTSDEHPGWTFEIPIHEGKEHMFWLPVVLSLTDTDDHTDTILPMYYLPHMQPTTETFDNRTRGMAHNSLSDETTIATDNVSVNGHFALRGIDASEKGPSCIKVTGTTFEVDSVNTDGIEVECRGKSIQKEKDDVSHKPDKFGKESRTMQETCQQVPDNHEIIDDYGTATTGMVIDQVGNCHPKAQNLRDACLFHDGPRHPLWLPAEHKIILTTANKNVSFKEIVKWSGSKQWMEQLCEIS